MASGQSAGHVAASARDSNRFTVSVNIEPESKVVFLLTYEELLERKNDQYELIVNIRPGQIVKDLNVKVSKTQQELVTILQLALNSFILVVVGYFMLVLVCFSEFFC